MSEELAAAMSTAAAEELSDALDTIRHCLGQLDDEQAWWRPAESMNSIGNLLLHLAGNLRQWIVSGVGGVAGVRERPAEFSATGPIPRNELLDLLERTVADAIATLAAIADKPPSELLRVRRVQGFEVTGLQATIASVAHFRGHTQEIIHLARTQLGDSYQFHFIPQTPEQGAR